MSGLAPAGLISVVRRLSSVVIFLLASCASPPTVAPPPTPAAVRVLATDMTEPLLLDLAAAYAEVNPSVAVVPGLAMDGVGAALAAGDAELALTAVPDEGFYATPVGYARLAVVVHPDNPAGPLSAAQVQALFAGEAGEWAQLGVPAAGPVQVVVAAEGSQAARLFAEWALPDSAPTVSALVAPSWGAMRDLVGADVNAVGYLPAAELSGAVRVLDQPDALRVLIVAMAISEPAGAARDFLAWAQSAAGQAVVGERYEAVR